MNDFPDPAALRRALRDPRVEEIEAGGLDEGRVFIHLKPGYYFDGYGCGVKSVGSADDVTNALAMIVRR